MTQALNKNNLQDLLEKYNALIEKITWQIYNNLTDSQKCTLEREDVKMCAVESFIIAVDDYDPNKSKMTFLSYVAFAMRNKCLSFINEESRTIAVPDYGQKQLKDRGMSTILTTSINNYLRDDDESDDHYAFMGYVDKHIGGNPITQLIDFIGENFDESTKDIFCSYFGIGDYPELRGMDLAKKYKVSNATISMRIHNVIEHIRKDRDMMDILSSLL